MKKLFETIKIKLAAEASMFDDDVYTRNLEKHWDEFSVNFHPRPHEGLEIIGSRYPADSKWIPDVLCYLNDHTEVWLEDFFVAVIKERLKYE